MANGRFYSSAIFHDVEFIALFHYCCRSCTLLVSLWNMHFLVDGYLTTHVKKIFKFYVQIGRTTERKIAREMKSRWNYYFRGSSQARYQFPRLHSNVTLFAFWYLISHFPQRSRASVNVVAIFFLVIQTPFEHYKYSVGFEKGDKDDGSYYYYPPSWEIRRWGPLVSIQIWLMRSRNKCDSFSDANMPRLLREICRLL